MNRGRGAGFRAVLAHSFFLQLGIYIVRPTVSYRALELGVDPALLGLVVGSFSLLPVFLAVWIGRRSDAGREPHILVLGAVLMVASGAGLLWATPGLAALLGWNVLLGVGHLMSLVAEQARLAASAPDGLDRVFGIYTTVTALSQAVAPLLLAVLGGDAVRPDTAVLLGAYLAATLALAGTTAAMVAGRFGAAARAAAQAAAASPPARLREALAVEPRRRLVLGTSIGLSMVVLCSVDLMQVYLPALAVERGIPAGTVGLLLALRAVATMASRAGLPVLVQRAGRGRLLIGSAAASGALLALVALPLPVWGLAVVLVFAGLALGIGQPLTLTVVSLVAAPGTRATWIALRLTGNRLGQAVLPVGVGLFAAGLGSAGVFLALGGLLGLVAAAAARPLRDLE